MADALKYFKHALGAFAAGRALAAGFFLAELHEEAGRVNHAGVFIHDNKAARAHDGPKLCYFLIVRGGVKARGRHAAARRAAQLRGLELLAIGDAAADVKNNIADRCAHGHFHKTDIIDSAGHGKHLGALGGLGAD